MEIDIIRLLIAFLCGYFLTVSGSLAQIVTNNKLASSSTLGFDGIGVLVILLAQFFITFLGFRYPIEHLSFFLFLLLFMPICLISLQTFKQNLNMSKIILIGLGFNLFVGGIFSVIQFLFLAINFEFPTGIWFGNFKFYDDNVLWLFSGIFIIVFGLVKKLSGNLAILSLGTSFAEGLGIRTANISKIALLLSFFLTGLVVSYFGVFSFIGLIFPHILRSFDFFKFDMKRELILGPLCTGVVLSGLDFVCFQVPFYGAEVPVGMVCSVVGSFVLLLLLMKKNSA
jgi:iron complex transport system permease protein